jgi:hypothetical protein
MEIPLVPPIYGVNLSATTINKHFRKGTNYLTAIASNNGGPAGLIAQLSLHSKKGKKQYITTDASWKHLSQRPNPQSKDWHTQSLPDAMPAIVVGKYKGRAHGEPLTFHKKSLPGNQTRLLNYGIACPAPIIL